MKVKFNNSLPLCLVPVGTWDFYPCEEFGYLKNSPQIVLKNTNKVHCETYAIYENGKIINDGYTVALDTYNNVAELRSCLKKVFGLDTDTAKKVVSLIEEYRDERGIYRFEDYFGEFPFDGEGRIGKAPVWCYAL